jgi:hypothetical protein
MGLVIPEPEPEPAESENEFEGWLTSDEACSELGGIAPATLTRAAQQKVVRRRQDPGSSKPRYLYDPASITEANEAGVFRTSPASENILNGGANAVRATNDLALRMGDKLLALVDKVSVVLDANTRANETMQKAMLSQFERVDKRCSQLETSQIEFIQAREQLLSEQNERDIEAAQAAQSIQLKERAIEGLFTNMPALLELWKMHTESQKEAKAEAVALPEKVEQAPQSAPPTEAIVVIEKEVDPHADS